MENLIQTEGIILKRTPYKDHNLILTLITKDEALIQVALKGGTKQPHLQLLNCIEIEYRKSEQELFPCLRTELISSFIHLRSDLKLLETAGDLIRVLNGFGAHSRETYLLLKRFFAGLTTAKNLDTLKMAFRLKLLYHEGFLPLETLSTLEKKIVLLRNFEQLQEIEVTRREFEQAENRFSLVTK